MVWLCNTYMIVIIMTKSKLSRQLLYAKKYAEHFTYNISFNPCKLCDWGVSNEKTSSEKWSYLECQWGVSPGAGNRILSVSRVHTLHCVKLIHVILTSVCSGSSFWVSSQIIQVKFYCLMWNEFSLKVCASLNKVLLIYYGCEMALVVKYRLLLIDL